MTLTDDRVKALQKLKVCSTLADLKMYISLTGFLRKFVSWYQQKLLLLQNKKTELITERRAKKEIPKTVIGHKKWVPPPLFCL
ncbi:hypothetical protein F4811DRAFT_530810 [Daldinia bambusicola]|nr:hypothetical protein F4811DRAFT_530810 [Daldinia bambusicola]